jgi:hypothetical protein
VDKKSKHIVRAYSDDDTASFTTWESTAFLVKIDSTAELKLPPGTEYVLAAHCRNPRRRRGALVKALREEVERRGGNLPSCHDVAVKVIEIVMNKVDLMFRDKMNLYFLLIYLLSIYTYTYTYICM